MAEWMMMMMMMMICNKTNCAKVGSKFNYLGEWIRRKGVQGNYC
jgi:hypothetical protein